MKGTGTKFSKQMYLKMQVTAPQNKGNNGVELFKNSDLLVFFSFFSFFNQGQLWAITEGIALLTQW